MPTNVQVDQSQMDGTEELEMQDEDPIDFIVDSKLFDERVIWIDGEIDDAVARTVCKRITMFNLEDLGVFKKERTLIRIFIRSCGGDLDCAFSIIDTIRTSATDVYTVNMGPCDSAAGLIFMAGNKRFMMPHSSVLIHAGDMELDREMSVGSFIDTADMLKRWMCNMYTYIAHSTKISSRTLEQNYRKEWRLDAKECLEYGVCDRIIASIYEAF